MFETVSGDVFERRADIMISVSLKLRSAGDELKSDGRFKCAHKFKVCEEITFQCISI